MATDLDVGTKDLWDVVGDLELPLLLIELDKFTVTDATKSFFKETGVTAVELTHYSTMGGAESTTAW